VNLNVLALVALFTGGLLVFSCAGASGGARRAQFALLRVLACRGGGLVAAAAARGRVGGALGAASACPRLHSAGFVLRHFGAELGGGYFRGLAPR